MRHITSIIKAGLIGLFFGTFGTTIGGFIGIKVKKSSNKFLGFILALASGLMTSIICFQLVPEAMSLSGLFNTVLGMIAGIAVMAGCDVYVDNMVSKSIKSVDNFKGNLLKTGMIISVGLAIHNFPEGLAIGSGFEASIKLGLSLAITICFHDIPEGLSMAIPLKNGGMKISKVMWYVVLSGITTSLGAILGSILGGISEQIIGFCLAFAAGAMIYIVSGELTPEANRMHMGKSTVIGNIIGILIGFIVMNI